jgi:phytanoyl-CoA hydroxylase
MASYLSSFLTPEQLISYEENGFIVIEDFWNEETVERLKQQMYNIISTADLSHVKTVFSTKEQARRSDEYFLSSGREIRYFWEEKAFTEDGNFVIDPIFCINKVGHGLHDLDPTFEQVSYDPRIGMICRELGMNKPLVVQSMYIFKQPTIGGEVCPHQDGAFLYTEPQTCIGFWWPLHDCNQENGCLWAVPKSHKLGVHRRFRRKLIEIEGEGYEEKDVETEFIPSAPIVL